MKDDAVAGTDMGLFSQFKASCCPHFHRPLLTPGAERAFGVNGREQMYCGMPVIQCIVCHLSPGGLLQV